MLFTSTLLVCASAITTVLAQTTQQTRIAFTQLPSTITAGKPITLYWAGGDSNAPVTLTLQQGSESNLQTVALITGSATGTNYTYTVPSNLPNAGNYAFKIQQGNDEPNYTGMISLLGGTTGGVTNAVSATASPSSSSSSGLPTPSRGVVVITANNGNTTTSTVSGNGTATATGAGSSAGTGTAMPRNTTMSSATLSSSGSGSSSASVTTATATTTTGGSGSGASAASSAAKPSSSSSAGQVASNFALLVCAFAGVAYLG